jgi:hypothetical protein
MNGEGTYEWRLQDLEKRMDRIEGWVIRGTVAALGNLVGVIILLAMKMAGK